MKKILYWFVAVLMLFTLSITAFAGNETNDGNIKIQVTTDKGNYSATGVAEITATITNISTENINNVTAQVVFDDLAPAGKRTSETNKTTDVLKAGESISFKYKATLNAKEHKLNIFQKIILWFVRFINGGYNASNNNINVVADCVTEIKFGKFVAENIIQVEYDEIVIENPDNNFEVFEEIRESIKPCTAYDKVLEVLKEDKENGNIKYYKESENKNYIIYETIDGIRGIWEDKDAMFEVDSVFKGISSDLISNDTEYNVSEYSYDNIVSQVSSLIVDDSLGGVVVIRPYRDNENVINEADKEKDLEYDNFKETGESIASAVGINVDVLDDGDATLEALKKLTQYSVILIDSHGALIEDEPYICLTQTFSEDVSVSDLEYILIDQYNQIRVNSDFFKNNYEDSAFDKCLVFLGTCYSMYDASFSDVLIDKGVDSVYGYTDLVTINYCNDTLSKLANILLNGKTSKVAYIETKSACGETDPINPAARFEMSESSDGFCLYKTEIEGEAIKESGYCGENAVWTLYEDGKLVISGSGAMEDYNSGAPWSEYKTHITTVEIENGITRIGSRAFYDCPKLKTIVIGDDIITIGEMAFALCTSVDYLTVSNNVENIEENAFALCINLENVILGDSVAIIGEAAFYGCKKLSNIKMPLSITTISKDAFKDCTGLSNVDYSGSKEQWDAINITNENNGNDHLNNAYNN